MMMMNNLFLSLLFEHNLFLYFMLPFFHKPVCIFKLMRSLVCLERAKPHILKFKTPLFAPEQDKSTLFYATWQIIGSL
jgi:hypothetical protein